MTEAQVLQLITDWIKANGNNEITGPILQNVLVEMLAQPNDKIGELVDLNTTDKSTVVAAINELINDINNVGGFAVKSGSADPNATPPSSFSIGDWYIRNGNMLYQYNGTEWVEIAPPGGVGDAASISYDNSTSGITAINVQAAIDEIVSSLNNVISSLDDRAEESSWNINNATNTLNFATAKQRNVVTLTDDREITSIAGGSDVYKTVLLYVPTPNGYTVTFNGPTVIQRGVADDTDPYTILVVYLPTGGYFVDYSYVPNGNVDLSDYETSTELDARDVANRARANHTGTQAIATVSGLQTILDGLSTDVGDNSTAISANSVNIAAILNSLDDRAAEDSVNFNSISVADFSTAKQLNVATLTDDREITSITNASERYKTLLLYVADPDGYSLTFNGPTVVVRGESDLTNPYTILIVELPTGGYMVDYSYIPVGNVDLSDYETSTELDARDTANRNRANHTGMQATSTITGLDADLTSITDDITDIQAELNVLFYNETKDINYVDFTTAYAAADPGDTLVMRKEATLSAVLISKDLNLNLGGNSIKSVSTTTSTIRVNNGAEVNIYNGRIEQNSTTNTGNLAACLHVYEASIVNAYVDLYTDTVGICAKIYDGSECNIYGSIKHATGPDSSTRAAIRAENNSIIRAYDGIISNGAGVLARNESYAEVHGDMTTTLAKEMVECEVDSEIHIYGNITRPGASNGTAVTFGDNGGAGDVGDVNRVYLYGKVIMDTGAVFAKWNGDIATNIGYVINGGYTSSDGAFSSGVRTIVQPTLIASSVDFQGNIPLDNPLGSFNFSQTAASITIDSSKVRLGGFARGKINAASKPTSVTFTGTEYLVEEEGNGWVDSTLLYYTIAVNGEQTTTNGDYLITIAFSQRQSFYTP